MQPNSGLRCFGSTAAALNGTAITGLSPGPDESAQYVYGDSVRQVNTKAWWLIGSGNVATLQLRAGMKKGLQHRNPFF